MICLWKPCPLSLIGKLSWWEFAGTDWISNCQVGFFIESNRENHKKKLFTTTKLRCGEIIFLVSQAMSSNLPWIVWRLKNNAILGLNRECIRPYRECEYRNECCIIKYIGIIIRYTVRIRENHFLVFLVFLHLCIGIFLAIKFALYWRKVCAWANFSSLFWSWKKFLYRSSFPTKIKSKAATLQAVFAYILAYQSSDHKLAAWLAE